MFRLQANPSYVIWTAAFNTTFLAGYLFVELLVFGAENKRQRKVVPPLMAAFNKNGLDLFLAVSTDPRHGPQRLAHRLLKVMLVLG